MGASPRGRPGRRRCAPGAGHRARRPRRAARPDVACARHRDRGDLARGRDARVPAAADASRFHRGVRRARPGAGSRTRDATVVVVDPQLAPFLAVEPGDPAGRRPRRAARRDHGRGNDRRRRPRRARHPPVHERLDRRPEGRDARRTAASCTTSTRSSKAPGSGPTDRGRLVAAAVPRHGSHRPADDADARRASTSCSHAPQDFLARTGRLDATGCRSSGARSPAVPTSRTRSRPRALRRLDGLDLSAWRMALNGAEPIDPDAVEAFSEAGARHGLDSKSPFCVYGMAEATLAISFPDPGTGMTVDVVDRRGTRERAVRRARDRRARGRAPARPARAHAARARAARLRSRDRGAATRPRGRRARAAGRLGHTRLLQPGRAHRGDVPRRLAAHRRPRLPRRRRARGLRANQGRDHRRRPQRVSRGDRAGRGRRSTASAPAT